MIPSASGGRARVGSSDGATVPEYLLAVVAVLLLLLIVAVALDHPILDRDVEVLGRIIER
jgi:hypothetical protein